MNEAMQATEAGPDLSGLDDALRRRIDVAVARGALWWPSSNDPQGAVLRNGELGLCLLEYGAFRPTTHLPDPENDPAAAWELATSEGIALVQSEDGWYALAPEDVEHGCVRGTAVPTLTLHGREHEDIEPANSPGRAVVDAYLAKHRHP